MTLWQYCACFGYFDLLVRLFVNLAHWKKKKPFHSNFYWYLWDSRFIFVAYGILIFHYAISLCNLPIFATCQCWSLPYGDCSYLGIPNLFVYIQTFSKLLEQQDIRLFSSKHQYRPGTWTIMTEPAVRGYSRLNV